MELKYFYKIENDKLIKGSGYKIPEGFTEYIIGNEPEELKGFLYSERYNKIKSNILSTLKYERDDKVNNIVITIDSGEVLNGNELAQTRLNRALNIIDDTSEIMWIDYNNDDITLTKSKIQEVLLKAGQEQTNIFIEYNKLRNNIDSLVQEELDRLEEEKENE